MESCCNRSCCHILSRLIISLILLTCMRWNHTVLGDKNYQINLLKFIIEAEESFGNFTDLKVHKYNRTTAALNGTFELFRDIPSDIFAELQGFEKIGNEYMLSGIQLKEDLLCNQLEKYRKLIFFPAYNKTTNFILECPIKKGVYYVNNYIPENDDLPDDVPGNFWRIDVNARYPQDIGKYLFQFQVFLEIERQIVNMKPQFG